MPECNTAGVSTRALAPDRPANASKQSVGIVPGIFEAFDADDAAMDFDTALEVLVVLHSSGRLSADRFSVE